MTVAGLVTEPLIARARAERIAGPDGSWDVLAGTHLTGGQLSFVDALLPSRTPGPARHVHKNEDEALFVIEGALTVEVADQRFVAGAGSLVWLPRQHPHAFANCSDEPCRLLGICVPGTLDGFFRELTQYSASLAEPPDLRVVEQIAAGYDITVLGPPLTA